MGNLAEKTEKSSPPVVAIDGAIIKAVRETKKLTQLYVASMVGVTTDTISRWENNRYPSIKRDNAEKLAAALEVELTEILRSEEAEEPVEEIPVPPAQVGHRRALILAVVVMVILLATAAVLFRQMSAIPIAERKLPRYGAPGAIIPVLIRVNRNDSLTAGLIVKERPPAGWHLITSMPPAASGQADAGEVKWLIPAGSGPITISYTVQVSPAASLKTTVPFDGETVTHAGGITRRAVSGGDRTMIVADMHWADRNGDGRIDDDEIMPAYYLTEEMKGMGLDWKTIEGIWSGKGYRRDPRTGEFQVIK